MVVRSIQKTGTKGHGGKLDRSGTTGARYLLLRPAGYPLKSLFQEYPVVSEPRLFERYAREQWYGEVVRPGCYLFDRRLYPDFAFKVIKAYPRVSMVGSRTSIEVESRSNTTKDISQVSLDDVVGQDLAKRKVKIIQRFLAQPEHFGRWAPRNVLFYGSSGTGKTMMARALSGEANVPLLPVKATELIGEFVGEGARQIHSLYEKAQQMAPCIIFIDELDAIALDRRYQDLRGDVSEIVNSLLTEMDGIHQRKGICTIAATNKIEFLDSSIRSRFEEEIEFKLPDIGERERILEMSAETLPVEMEGVDLKAIARITEGLSGRDMVEKVLKVSLHQAIIEECCITQSLLDEAVRRCKREVKEAPKEMFS
ncbi:MAG: AAA family ATPase [Methanotrichaceae archaeon]|nr:AAA family ATPase [Methanotrichaceae archaeon]